MTQFVITYLIQSNTEQTRSCRYVVVVNATLLRDLLCQIALMYMNRAITSCRRSTIGCKNMHTDTQKYVYEWHSMAKIV